MKKLFAVCSLFIAVSAVSASALADDMEKLDKRLDNAKITIDQIMSTPDKKVPDSIARNAVCVGVVPGMVKGAFTFGAEYGQGVVTCRTGHGWSAPVFIRMAGGSFGFQAGGQGTDLILVAVNDRGFQDLLKSKFKIGGDAAAAAGPVGRDSQAATDWKLTAELLTYSRARGLFAGIDLTGAVVNKKNDPTRPFYVLLNPNAQILKGEVAVPDDAKPFVRTVAKYFADVRK